MLNWIKLNIDKLLPHEGITRLFGWIARGHLGMITQILIKLFIFCYKVKINDAQVTDIRQYKSFNDFFTRQLKKSARPISDAAVIQPTDGIISQIGAITGESIVQAKNHNYQLSALLGGNHELTQQFIDGAFINSYLAPNDYHRVHMPCDGVLKQMIYIPGKFFSVNPLFVQHIPNLFARNERVITIFETPIGLIAQILVGATIAGSIETVWAGCVNQSKDGVISYFYYPPADNKNAIKLMKGEEMGLFKIGSTVITLFQTNKICFFPDLIANSSTCVGAPLATIIKSTASLEIKK